MSDTPLTAYKVLTSDQMTALEEDGSFKGSPADLADGFVHLSTAAQLDATLAKHYAGQNDLHLAAVDLGAYGDSLKWEAARGGDLFPHLYEPLLLETVVAYGPLRRDDDGRALLPVAG